MLSWIENIITKEYAEAENEPDYRCFLKAKLILSKKQDDILMEQILKYDDLIKAFREIGIGGGTILEVHSSLSSFGYVEGGAETVIRALKDVVGTEGSIFMPALRLSHELPLSEEDKKFGISIKIKILPEERKRSAMGIIADTFRMQPDTVMGDGIFQISGWGKYADEATKGGLDFAINNGGMALLLGVDIYKLTAMHYVEDAIPGEINKMFANDESINEIYPRDEWLVETKHPSVKPWYTIQALAYEKGLIKEGYIGKCKYMYFNIFNVVSLYKQELENNPYKLYGLNS